MPSSDASPIPRRCPWCRRVWPLGVLLVGLLVGVGLRWGADARLLEEGAPLPSPASVSLPSPTAPTASATPSPAFTPTSTATPSLVPSPAAALHYPGGLTVLALQEGAFSQLFAFSPTALSLTRLTAGATDHITPAFSPDGRFLAYAARRAHGWDLFLLSLADGTAIPLTDDAAYDAAPSWSPDGRWLVYEHDEGENLDLYIRPADGGQAPIRLTVSPAADYAPAWGPQGRVIAFVSTREGSPQIFLANLDEAGAARFLRLSRPQDGPARHPAWSPDGRYLAWGQTRAGVPLIFVWDAAHPDRPARAIGMGWWPQWGSNDTLAAVVRRPNGAALTAYAPQRGLALPLIPLPGTVRGFALHPTASFAALAFRAAARLTPTPAWTPAARLNETGKRFDVVPLHGVQVPYPWLSDAADEAFAALRQVLAAKAGWDVLGTLENAYVPLTAPLPPGLGQDWLYTGRAFALPVAPLHAGWMVVVREDIAPYTYWRVFVRAKAQDGSQGEPLHALPWDFDARNGGDITAFEQGGAYAAAVPPGYWVDVTALAQALGWERLPALPNWRAYIPAARFNEFALRQGLTWEEAMRQIFPAQAIPTPTPHATPAISVVPPTPTPGR